MRVSEIQPLKEAFDKPYEIEGPYGEYSKVEFYFETEPSKTVYNVKFVDEGYNDWVLSFKDTIKGTHVTKDHGSSSIKIFSTVFACAKMFLEDREVNSLKFGASSDEPSRVKLYDMLSRKLSKKFTDFKYTRSKEKFIIVYEFKNTT